MNPSISYKRPQATRLGGVLLLAGLELLQVEVELLALEDVAVSAAGLAGARGDDGEETTGLELLGEVGVDLGVLLALGKDTLDVVRLLDLLGGGLGGGDLGADNSLGVVGLVPLTEGGGVNLNDGRLDEGLGTEKLVVGGVVALEKSVSKCGSGVKFDDFWVDP